MTLNYDQPFFHPPSEGDDLIIQAALDCSFYQRIFCAMYRSKDFVERPLDEAFTNIRQFDGNALALPTEHLLTILCELAASLENAIDTFFQTNSLRR
jgi:hypothetical protein